MKKYLPRLFSLNLLYKTLFFLAVVASIGYLVPSFSKDYKGKKYVFENLRSAFDEDYQDLTAEGVKSNNKAYRYRVEAITELQSERDWNTVVAEDQKTLERRVESYLGSSDYEIELQNHNGKAVFFIYTASNVQGFEEILTRNNSDFQITVPDLSAEIVSDPETGEASETPTLDLNLTRSDFGFADIGVVQGGTNGIEFEVKMPIGLIGPEKLNRIRANYSSNLTVFVGGKEYTGSFLEDSSTIVNTEPRNLRLKSISSIVEARAVKSFLNTSKFNLGYKLDKVEVLEDKYNLLKLVATLLIVIVSALLLNLATIKTISLKKTLYILGYIVIGFGLLKLFGVVLTDGFVFVLLAFTLMTIFSMRWSYYVGFFGILVIIKIFGYLYFISLEWSQILILAVTCLALYTTNNIKNLNKKYA